MYHRKFISKIHPKKHSMKGITYILESLFWKSYYEKFIQNIFYVFKNFILI